MCFSWTSLVQSIIMYRLITFAPVYFSFLAGDCPNDLQNAGPHRSDRDAKMKI